MNTTLRELLENYVSEYRKQLDRWIDEKRLELELADLQAKYIKEIEVLITTQLERFAEELKNNQRKLFFPGLGKKEFEKYGNAKVIDDTLQRFKRES